MSTTPLLFYRERDQFGCFSNFKKARIIVDGQEFVCNEQYIMYMKARLFNDHVIAQKILQTSDPMKIKAYGREIKGFDEQIWTQNREKIADQCNRAKFTQNEDLKKILLSTGDVLIAEASPNDKIWGIGVDTVVGKDINKWKGLNILGQSLMRIRQEISSTYKNNQ